MKLKILKFKSVKSTNTEAIRLIKTGKSNIGLITTEKQTNGRGTMGKKWISEKGNLFISIFFKVNLTKIKIESFLKINSKTIKKILSEYTKNVITIKYPNDLMIKKKKLCGILQETIEYKSKKYLVTGIGINTMVSPKNKNFSSTCLKDNAVSNFNNQVIIRKIQKFYENLIKDLEKKSLSYIEKKYT